MGGLGHARVPANGRARGRHMEGAAGLGCLRIGATVGRRVGAVVGHGMRAGMATQGGRAVD